MDLSLNEIVSWAVDELKESPLYSELYRAALDLASDPKLRVTEVQEGVQKGLIANGHEKKLRNAVYKLLKTRSPALHPSIPAEHFKEPLSYLRKAQLSWEKRILKSVNSMCTELGLPLARKRPDKDQYQMNAKWTELGVDEPDLSKFRPVYAPKDFLEVLVALRSPDVVQAESASFMDRWGLIAVPVNAKSLQQLRVELIDMSISQPQTGVEDQATVPSELFENQRSKLSKKVVEACDSAAAQELARRGCPISQRKYLWRLILGLDVQEADRLYYEQLKQSTLTHELLVDNLLYKDVKLTATNDDQYFVFEDYLYQVLLPFARDTTLLQNFQRDSSTPPKAYIRGKLGVEEFSVNYPPSGVIPFHGFSMLVVPLCTIFDDPVQLYFVFREIYCRFFFRLHSISSHPQGILSLCVLFEELLQTTEPHLFLHLKAIGAQPLRIAFKWLFRAFSGFLSSDEVLLLWDRILAYESLEILAVLAVCVFRFRKANLMQVQTFNAAEAVLTDLTHLHVVPLLQLGIFTG